MLQYTTSLESLPATHAATAPDPLLTIDDPTLALYQVVGTAFQADGRIVVANGGAPELLFFTAAGALVARTGAAGGGPGEFRQITQLFTGPADSVFVYDQRARRVSVFTPNGAFVRDVALGGVETIGPVEQLGILASGTLVVAFRQTTAGVGLRQDSLVVATLRPDGNIGDVLAMVPHVYRHWGPHELPGGAGVAAIPLPVAFAGVTAVGVGTTTVHIGLPEEFSLLWVDREGLRRVTRLPFTAPSVTEEHREQFFGRLSTGRMAAKELALLRGIRGRGTIPPFGHSQLTARVGEPGLVVTSVGEIWLRPFIWSDTGAIRWIRFDESGLYRGSVTLPLRFTLMAVQDDLALGVARDGDDVESVQLWRLVESG